MNKPNFTMLCQNGCGRKITITEKTFNRLKAGEDLTVICCICTLQFLSNSPEMLELWLHMQPQKWIM